MATIFTDFRPRRRVLLPVATLLATGTFLVTRLGTAFQAPPVKNPLPAQSAHHGLQAATLAGQTSPSMWQAPAAAVSEDEIGYEAPGSAVLAVTALAALAAAADAGHKKQGFISRLICRAEASSGSEKKGLWETVKLPVYACLWYFFNVQYNIQNKKLLNAFSAPWAVSWVQLAAGIPIAMLMWATGFVKAPSVTKDDVLKLAPVGAAFAGGQVATVASLGAVAVSFTHVVKALEPAVNAIASALVLGQVFHPMVYASLAPVFLGVALASSSELSFTMFGFLTAMASNFFFVTRNVLATKLGGVGDMGEDATTRKTNQLAVLTCVATMVLLPVALLLPGGLLSAPAAWNAAIAKGIAPSALAYMMAASGFHFFMYQLSSFWVLSCVPPITHSVLNTLKRVVIIIVSIVVFRTPVTTQSALGTATAIGGVLLYSLTKAHYSKKK